MSILNFKNGPSNFYRLILAETGMSIFPLIFSLDSVIKYPIFYLNLNLRLSI